MIKLIKPVLLILSAAIFLVGCRAAPDYSSSDVVPGQVSSVRKTKDSLTLLYSASDSFNPYTAKSEINRQLLKLVFDPLVKLDNEYNVKYCVAESVTLNGTECTAKLSDRKFSDGSAVTADDVVSSFALAKASASEYGYKLYGAVSARAQDARTVVFKLAKADPYFANVLDFPIIKKGTENRVDSDSVALPPIGCGRYVPSDGATVLVLNTASCGNAFNVKKIKLLNAPDPESVSHYAEIGAADVYYSDISDGNIVRMSGKKINININRMVYLAVNANRGVLADANIRQALSTAIDRTAVCRDSFYNNALAATGFYNPVWAPIKSVQNIEKTANKEITVEILEKLGYNSVDGDGVRRNGGTKLKFELLVNSENRMRAAAAQIIAANLAECGISVKVTEKNFADYTAALSSGNFELCLAETEITPNMDLTNLVTEGGSTAYGVKYPKPEENAAQEEGGNTGVALNPKTPADLISGFYSGENTVADVASVLQTEMPFIPVCYRTGVLFYNDNIENVNGSSASDIYFSIDSYTCYTK